MAWYCNACETARVDVSGGTCERCAGLGRAAHDYDRHEVDGYELVKKGMSMLNKALEELRLRLGDPEIEPTTRDDLLSKMSSLGRSVAVLAKEARAFEEYMSQSASTMTKAQKMAVIIPLFESLSPDEQKSFIQKLLRSYNDRSQYKIQER